MPDGAFYWYGNEVNIQVVPQGSDPSITALPVTWATNYVQGTLGSNPTRYDNSGIKSINAVDFSQFTSLKCITEMVTTSQDTVGTQLYAYDGGTNVGHAYVNESYDVTITGVKRLLEIDLSSIVTSNGFTQVGLSMTRSSYPFTARAYAIWAE